MKTPKRIKGRLVAGRQNCIAFTGGGTAGHVFPAVSIVQNLLKDWSGRVIWIGSRSGMEKKLLSGVPVTYYGIPSGKWRRYLSIRNFLDPFKVVSGILYSLALLGARRPLLLFSKGGYVSVPPVVAARLLGIPVFTHESDFDPGLANRLNALFAERIFTSFAETRDYFPAKLRRKVLLTGNPIRDSFLSSDAELGRRIIGCVQPRPIVLVIGGSQGSVPINNLVSRIVARLTDRAFVVHQMGWDGYSPTQRPNYFTTAFFGEEFPHILACADLVVSRAGANTLAELAALGKPAILIPLPLSGSRGDQIRNARFFSDQGASILFNEETGSPEDLLEIMNDLLDNRARLRELGRRMASLGFPQASRTITRLIRERMN